MLKSAFNRIVMPDARYITPDAQQSISLNGYDPKRHKGHLICSHCDAKVHFNKGAALKDGANSYQPRHFRTNPKQKHGDACSYGQTLANRPAREHQYNDNLGYRLNLDIAQISGWSDPNHKLRPFSNDDFKWLDVLYTMQPIAIKNMDDMAVKMQELNSDRLRRSAVVWHDKVMPMRDFFIHGTKRWESLINKLKTNTLKHPVLLYLEPTKKRTGDVDQPVEFQCKYLAHPKFGTVNVYLSLKDEAAATPIKAGGPVIALCRPTLWNGTLHAAMSEANGITNFDLNKAFVPMTKPETNSVLP